ncbi:MAG TPA: protein translocase subunit SecD [Gaiellaceae bacterium]|nr:protein translocase subunit SecD [Gaiellaceae bacterium]
MNRRASLLVVAFLAAALAGVALLAFPGSPLHQKPTLGLDLQGGLEVTLQAVPPADRELTDEDLDRSVDIMRNRVDKLGVTEPEIRKQGSDQIVIQLPGVSDPEAAAEIIGTTAQLELYDLERSLTGPSIAAGGFPVEHTSLYRLLARVQAQTGETASAYYVVNTRAERVVSGPFGTEQEALESVDGELPANRRLFGVPEGMVVITCGAGAVVCPGGQQGSGLPPTQTYYYLFTHDPPRVPQLTGEDFKLEGTRADFDTSPGGGGRPIVTMEFTDDGGDRFQDVTRDLWIRGKTLNAPQHFAIVLDREIKTFPQIDYTDNSLSGGIGGGRAQIQGLESIREARDIAIVLQTGALPVEFQTLQRTDISATLGKDSLSEAWRAAAGGIVLVAIFLLLFYRFLGLVAVAGIGIYAAFLYATILIFNVTLTLPGFAGLVLTFGVAADANIVIFERIKDEVRAGRSVRAAITAGYRKGFATIVDANVVTAITAMVLFAVATASVRGFALMLLLGIALSMLTAVLATRAILGLLAGASWIDNPRLMGMTGKGLPRRLRFDFIGKRNVWFAFSGVLVAICLGALVLQGLNLGIDFRGGTQITFSTPGPTALTEVRSEAAKVGQAGAVIQGRGESTADGRYQEFSIRTESLTVPAQNELQRELARAVDATGFGATSVSESFGRQILNSALLAIFVSLLLIVFYISFRFQWKFSIGVVVAMAHDVLITIGVYALLSREVSTATVAAVLTVLGYSIYDTIIIYDRIRENVPLMRRASFRVIGNVSLWEVLPRSLATTLSTLLPIAALYVYGGDTLKDFAFALLVGIGAGTYSSIFVAAPLLAMFKEREPEYARRRDDLGALAGVESVGGTLAADATAIAGDDGDGRAPVEAEGTGEETQPEPVSTRPPSQPSPSSASKRERRRQRRASRPHGRPR